MEIPTALIQFLSGLQYTVFLKPGEVGHFKASDFFRADVENVIAQVRKIRSATDEPKIRSPGRSHIYMGREEGVFVFDCADLDRLLDGIGWEDYLRIHHALGCLLITTSISQWAYSEFHRELRLGSQFAIAQCAEAWVKIPQFHYDLLESFSSSPGHFVFKHRDGRSAVFNKTAFVQSRLDSMAEEEEAQRAAALAEQLRRSRFTTFVYLMEDPRNGAFKIGRSKTPGIRERTLQAEAPEILLRFSIPAEERHERDLHTLFQNRRVRGEWFQLTTNEVLEVIAFLKKNGDAERASGDFEWLGRLFASSSSASQGPTRP